MKIRCYVCWLLVDCWSRNWVIAIGFRYSDRATIESSSFIIIRNPIPIWNVVIFNTCKIPFCLHCFVIYCLHICFNLVTSHCHSNLRWCHTRNETHLRKQQSWSNRCVCFRKPLKWFGWKRETLSFVIIWDIRLHRVFRPTSFFSISLFFNGMIGFTFWSLGIHKETKHRFDFFFHFFFLFLRPLPAK